MSTACGPEPVESLDDDLDDDLDDEWWPPIDCTDCGRQVWSQWAGEVEQNYAVHDEVWAAAGMGRGWLCVECLEARLHRPLTGADFPSLPINTPGWYEDTARLAALKREAQNLGGRR